MRISDWSSDVFSSDLFDEPRNNAISVFGTRIVPMSKILLITTVLLCAAATTACTSQIRQSVHADQEIENDVAISHGESKTRAEEIGRESGRERVSQYV